MRPRPSLEAHCESRELAGTFENMMLYRMCKENPLHTDWFVNSGKIISIGRIYSARAEAGLPAWISSDQSLIEHLGKRFAQFDLDSKLDGISEESSFFDGEIKHKVLDVHEYLVCNLKSSLCQWIKRLPKREKNYRAARHESFASKYLHFHRPNAFPIMDSIVKIPLSVESREYKEFCAQFEQFGEAPEQEQKTLRSLDRCLYKMGIAANLERPAS